MSFNDCLIKTPIYPGHPSFLMLIASGHPASSLFQCLSSFPKHFLEVEHAVNIWREFWHKIFEVIDKSLLNMRAC